MITVRISEDALQDLNDGFLFYEAQQPGLGDYFASCLRADIEGLRVGAVIRGVGLKDRSSRQGVFLVYCGHEH
jgi:hypothetical protein